MLRWATIHKKLVARLCATLVASGSLAMAGEIKKNRHPIRRVSAEETAVEVVQATEAAVPVDFAEADEDAVPAELAQAERAADRNQVAVAAVSEDDGADVFDAALHPDPWCAPGAFTGPQQPSQYDSQTQNALQNPQAALNQPRNNFDFSGGQNYVSAGSSRHVPAFMGDFFGGGRYQPVFLPGIAGDWNNAGDLPTSWDVDSNGFAVADFLGLPGGLKSTEQLVDGTTGNIVNGLPYTDTNGDTFAYVFTDPEAVAQLLGIGLVFQGGSATRSGGPEDSKLTSADEFEGTVDARVISLLIADIPLSATAGRVKLSENSSPIPRDRILMNYSYFSNVGLAPGGVNVNRITPGFEKTLFSKNLSLEVRTPMAVTLDQDLQLNQTGGLSSQGFNQVEMGDVTATLKAMFYQSESTALSAGMGMSFPTSDDISLRLSSGVESLRIDHRSVHVMPFVGGVYTPNDRFFGQWIAQVDVATNPDPVLMNLDPNGLFSQSTASGLQRTGAMTDPTFLYLDGNVGYWTYRSEDPNESGLSGLAVVSELHYNRSLQNFDEVSSSIPGFDPAYKFTVGNSRAYLEQLNFMVGCVAEIGGNSVISTGYAVPLTGSPIFSGEFRMTYNYYFGRSSRRVNQFGNRPPGLL